MEENPDSFYRDGDLKNNLFHIRYNIDLQKKELKAENTKIYQLKRSLTKIQSKIEVLENQMEKQTALFSQETDLFSKQMLLRTHFKQ